MKPYETPEALAKAIRIARGPMSQKALSEWLGWDRKTIGRMERGEEGTLGKTVEARRRLAILIAEATGNREALGLSAPEPKELDRLAVTVSAQAKAMTTLAEELASERKVREGMLKRIERLERGEEGSG